MKRLLVLSVCLLVLFGLVATVSASQEGKLLIWADELRAAVLRDIGQSFTKQYGIPVEVRELGFGDIRDQLGVAGPAGEGPDIIVGAHDWLGQLVVNGLLEPIDLGARAKDFVPVSLTAFTWGKTLYGVPYAIESVGLFYNKKLVPTPPKTFDELIAIAKKLTNKDKKEYGFLLPQPDPYHTFPLMSAAGGYVFGTKPDSTLDPLDVGLNNKGAIGASRSSTSSSRMVSCRWATRGRPAIPGAQTPAGATDILISYTYRLAFESAAGTDYGLAAAVTMIIFLIVGTLSWINFRFTGALEEVRENA